MTARRLEPTLRNLLEIVIGIDDPMLCERASDALSALLAELDDTVHSGDRFEWS